MTSDERSGPLIPVPVNAGGGGSDDVRQDQAQEQTPNKWFIMCPEDYNDTSTTSCSYSTKKLDRADVNFVPCTNHYLAYVVWNDDSKCKCMPWMSLKVETPKLCVQDTRECVLRNVMALEQCVYPSEPYVCSYFYLLDDLIDTAEDVELLVEKRIIECLLCSNDAVAELVRSTRWALLQWVERFQENFKESLLQGSLDWQFYCCPFSCEFMHNFFYHFNNRGSDFLADKKKEDQLRTSVSLYHRCENPIIGWFE